MPRPFIQLPHSRAPRDQRAPSEALSLRLSHAALTVAPIVTLVGSLFISHARASEPPASDSHASPSASPSTITLSHSRWTKVAPGSSDFSPINTELRLERIDLRVPSHFEGVYALDHASRLLGRPPAASSQGLFARFSAGMAAVFPRSSYTPVAPGVVHADIPAGTVFVPIHDLDAFLAREHGHAPSDPAASALIASLPAPRASATEPSRQSPGSTHAVEPANDSSASIARAFDPRVETSAPRESAAPARPSTPARTSQASPSHPTPAAATIWTSEWHRACRIGELLASVAPSPTTSNSPNSSISPRLPNSR